MDIKLLSPSCWTDYELIDSGAFEKLERFGRYVIARPEPQAIWNKSLSDAEWQQRADAYFKKDKKSEDRGDVYKRQFMYLFCNCLLLKTKGKISRF